MKAFSAAEWIDAKCPPIPTQTLSASCQVWGTVMNCNICNHFDWTKKEWVRNHWCELRKIEHPILRFKKPCLFDTPNMRLFVTYHSQYQAFYELAPPMAGLLWFNILNISFFVLLQTGYCKFRIGSLRRSVHISGQLDRRNPYFVSAVSLP